MKTNTKVAEQFANIMVRKMEEMKADGWIKPWFDISGKKNFFPQNYSGRRYTSGNAFFLMLACAWRDYKTPIFLTFNQCKSLEINVTKNEKSFPVYYKSILIYNRENNKRISIEDYNLLTDEEKKKWRIVSYLKYYNVFNLDQTNFSDVHEEEFMSLIEKFNTTKTDFVSETLFECDLLDTMIEDKLWVCDISLEEQNNAYYSQSKDYIVCPTKKQFPNQHNFYGTLLHEMTHSTGTPERLNRVKGKTFGDNDYAREEIIAELTAAFTGSQIGVFVEPSKDSVTYLNGWIKVLKQSPDFVFSLLEDVVKASNYIMENVNIKVEVLEKVAQ